ncbi:sialate O-acetylesterase [Paenibacillus sp. PAMC21692]|uniref:sialate O-acetylesterase n=1 Tax=Paenibacillus sp. PAMC21692 TaxID=2762320 RepID=UPI0021C278B1|nr:sialate O-acetylesterase [Paenibacillus sp. PAMC21692]
MDGPSNHRVYQRDEIGQADISYKLTLSGESRGVIEVLLLSAAGRRIGSARWETDGPTYKGCFREVHTGSYRIECRFTDGGLSGSIVADPVHVGDLWVLAGQSNMEGCGKLIEVEMPQTGVSCFYMGDKWDIAHEPLCWLNESLDRVNWRVPENERGEAADRERRDRTIGAGLGIPFAKTMLRHTGVPIGLIMCAHGGSSMIQWGKTPNGDDDAGSSLYGAMLRKIIKLGGKIKGCLWYQGEAEADGENAPRYADRMKAWVADLRHDLGDRRIPFIYAQLSVVYFMDSDAVWWNRIQDEQLKLEEALVPAAMVPTIDAELSDIIHLSTHSLREIGHRMALQALRTSYGYEGYSTGPRPDRVQWNNDRTELLIVITGTNGYLINEERIYGFSAEANGLRLPISAAITPDRQGIVIRFEGAVPRDCRLMYGSGFNPTTNVKDALGIPLPVFGPMSV